MPVGGTGDPDADRDAMMRRDGRGVMSHVVGESRAPAVLAFDARGRLLHHSASATALLATLLTADVDERRAEERRADEPPTVAHVVHALGGEHARVVHGRDGRTYQLHVLAAASPADDPDAPRTFVVIDRTSDDDGAHVASVARRFGFSPREREILRGVARGDATKAIAAALGLSMHTVQEYVGRACRKAGVRTRRELVARLIEHG
ncbi:regulatory protein LuxR [Gemmatirosa kalamazoonensis]|uniref:Regulatory protein LuxR n=1 Tax=Gemmatirosa kalamazoonensis TaxID=861299 RepID=W0RJV7_9BACT|nr:helix-turn-helix transcriptional regulator [Gemmatirosa kalamazoonensis]AHG90702.1 regulatory protein LuxR [Gemmatirosa kalamazoonensis]